MAILMGCYLGATVTVNSFYNIPQPMDVYNQLTGQNISSNIFINLIAVCISVFSIFYLLKFFQKVKLGYARSLTVYISLCLIVVFLLSSLSMNKCLNAFMLVSIVVFIKQFSYMLLMLGYKKFPISRFKDFLFIIQPMWDTSWSARPEVMLPISTKNQNELDKEAFRLSIFFVMVLSVSVACKFVFFQSQLYGYNLGIFPLYKLSTIPQLMLEYTHLSRLKILFHLFCYGIMYLFGYLATPIAVDAGYRLLGFEPLRQYYNPTKANSGGDLYNRVIPYYVHSMNIIFVFPIYKYLIRNLTPKLVSYNLALFLGIFIYGYFIHLFVDIVYFVQYSFFEVVKNEFLLFLPYSAAVFLVIKGFDFRINRIFNPLKIIVILFIFGTMMLFRHKPMEIPIAQKYELLNFTLFHNWEN